MTVMWVVFGALVVGTLPAVVRAMYPPLFALRPKDLPAPQAVVVLGSGRRQLRGHYISGVAGLRRLQHGLAEARQRKLPLLLCGGRKRAPDDAPSEASLLAEEVRWRAPLQSVWTEEESRNTWENAEFGARLLKQRGVRRVLLVTDRPHMTRALLCFRAQGLEVEVAPLDRLPASNWVPTAAALALIPEIWYEWLALCWYGVRWH